MSKTINIIGNGYMGSQISSLFSLIGYKVNIFYNKNKNETNFSSNIKIIGKKLNLKTNKLNFEYHNNLDKIQNFPTIECVSENFEIKKKIFLKIFDKFENNIFSNTSSININKINSKISILHFMNPVFLNIVEIYKSRYLDSNGEELINSLKREEFTTINNKSSEDIVLNKVIFSEISQFFNLIEVQKINKTELLNSINKIKGNNFLHTLDIIGIDTCLEIIKNLNELDDRFYIPKIFEIGLKKNVLGKKNRKSINEIFLSNNYPEI
tara:strand:- start:362 stop:1162 length:801 start_codon:yes stop_codon:yes gene_type:complete